MSGRTITFTLPDEIEALVRAREGGKPMKQFDAWERSILRALVRVGAIMPRHNGVQPMPRAERHRVASLKAVTLKSAAPPSAGRERP